MFSRRKLLQTSLFYSLLPQNILQAKVKEKFHNPFQVPPLAIAQRKGRDLYFNLRVQSGKSAILPNVLTPTLGINLPFLGETIRANRGDRVHIKVKNSLNEATTLHWHGMKLPAKMDGGPHQPIPPDTEWTSDFEIIQNAATLWYHSHQMHQTGKQVYLGLAGMFILDDEKSRELNLPKQYGEDDFPVIIQDRDFEQDGSFRYIRSMHDIMMGKTGDTILVNGVINPVLKTDKSLIRLRLLNGSNARIYQLTFDDQRAFELIASDGGLLEKPIQTKSITLAPAERVEILVDVSDGKMPVLMHKSVQKSNSQGGLMGMMMKMIGMNGDQHQHDDSDTEANHDDEHDSQNSFSIFQIDARSASTKKVSIPDKLVDFEAPPQEIVRRRVMKLEMKMGPEMMMSGPEGNLTINGKTMEMSRIDETVQSGSSEIWVIENHSMYSHPFHIHNVQFKIIKREGGVSGHETGYKDIVLVHPNEPVEVLMIFPEFRDPDIPYMYHCHILEHEDAGMMGQFVTV
ncbi:MAG: multicopper oxidase family protein [Fidelibacterota bacterium]